MELRVCFERVAGWLLLFTIVGCWADSAISGRNVTATVSGGQMVGGVQTAAPIPPALTTVTPEYACQYFNNSCEECVKHTRCYYCYSTSQCLYYPFASGFPSPRDCDMGEVRWAVCWFNFKALIISLSVMAGVLLISLSLCLYCCCRKKKTKNSTKYAQEEARREREREERRIRSEERKMERKMKNDEIRRKYGLMKEETPYERFDA